MELVFHLSVHRNNSKVMENYQGEYSFQHLRCPDLDLTLDSTQYYISVVSVSHSSLCKWHFHKYVHCLVFPKTFVYRRTVCYILHNEPVNHNPD